MELSVNQAEKRLDKFLAEKIGRFSRNQWQKIIEAGAVKINNHSVIKPGKRLRPGDQLIIADEKLAAPPNELKVAPDARLKLDIVYEDADLIVINKPAGLIVHPTVNQPRHTLANALIALYPEMISVGENALRPGIVHRLDKETSGLIIAVKNQPAFYYIKEQFLKRQVIKKYWALVEGIPKEKSGVIEYSIRPSKKYRLKKVAIKSATAKSKKSDRTASTFYRVIQEFKGLYALVEASPKTGRTHQIRVHLSAIGHPIVGDSLYGSKSKLLKRQFLHAYYLKFKTPTGQELALEAELPPDLKKVLELI